MTERAKESAAVAGIIACAVAIVAIIAWWELSIWAECRADHSWLYCVRVLG